MVGIPGQQQFGFYDAVPKPSAPPGGCPWHCKARPQFAGKKGNADRWQCPECHGEWEVLDTRPGRKGGAA